MLILGWEVQYLLKAIKSFNEQFGLLVQNYFLKFLKFLNIQICFVVCASTVKGVLHP